MATYNVNNGSDSGVGSLRSAIESANVNPGTDDILIQTDIQLNSAIEISESVNIGAPFGATITQTKDDRIFDIDDRNSQQESEINLYRLNLTGGNAKLGGAIISQENLTITDSYLYENSAAVNGSAVSVLGANLTVERSRLEDNQIIAVGQEISRGSAANPASDLDLYVFEGKLKVINSILDRAEEPIVAKADSKVTPESLITNDSEIMAEVTLKKSASKTTPQTDIQSDEDFVGSDDAKDTLITDIRNKDSLDGGDGDVISGSDNDDTLNGTVGNDTLLGSDGNDLLLGAAGNDIIHGHHGDDILFGSTGDDTLHGDEGNDTLSGEGGDNFLTGGDGSDLFNLTIGGNSVIADFEIDTDKLQLFQLTYSDLKITGDVNTTLDHQGVQIGMVMGISPTELTQASFVEV